jgi:hypothetical protein
MFPYTLARRGSIGPIFTFQELLLDTAWKLNDWNLERDTLNQVMAVQPEAVKHKLYQCYVSIAHPKVQSRFAPCMLGRMGRMNV